jgi:KUP system potassium uptake protein
LEDDFDGQNRMNLRRFIGSNESEKPHSDDDASSESDYHPLSYYYIQNPLLDGPIDEKTVEQRREIQRIPTFAIFHKLAPGKGVPHTFVGEFAFLHDLTEINSRRLLV